MYLHVGMPPWRSFQLRQIAAIHDVSMAALCAQRQSHLQLRRESTTVPCCQSGADENGRSLREGKGAVNHARMPTQKDTNRVGRCSDRMEDPETQRLGWWTSIWNSGTIPSRHNARQRKRAVNCKPPRVILAGQWSVRSSLRAGNFVSTRSMVVFLATTVFPPSADYSCWDLGGTRQWPNHVESREMPRQTTLWQNCCRVP